MHRREAREFLLGALYQREFRDFCLEDLVDDVDPGAQREYIEKVYSGIVGHAAEIDKLIATRTTGWRFERLSPIDKSILRLAVYELLYMPDIPPEVAINEAVELSKAFGTDQARVYVNGILDRIWKDKGTE